MGGGTGRALVETLAGVWVPGGVFASAVGRPYRREEGQRLYPVGDIVGDCRGEVPAVEGAALLLIPELAYDDVEMMLW